MPLWFQTETRVRTHQKMLRAGRAACWTWVCGNCYAKDQMTDGFVPEAMLASLVPGVALREIKRDAEKLVEVGLWEPATAGYQIHDYLHYNDSKAAILAKLEADRLRKQDQKSKKNPAGNPEDSDGIPFSVSGSDQDPEKKDAVPKPHPVRDWLTEHSRLFVAKYGQKPTKYSGKDAKHAKDLIDQRGDEWALKVLRQAFVSPDPFIAKSGHAVGVIVSSAVQNKLISELSTARQPHAVGATSKSSSLRVIDEMEAKRHAG